MGPPSFPGMQTKTPSGFSSKPWRSDAVGLSNFNLSSRRRQGPETPLQKLVVILSLIVILVPSLLLALYLLYALAAWLVLGRHVPVHALRGMGMASWKKPPGFNGEVAAPFPQLHHLVMVAGHSVYVGSDLTKPREMASWFLEDYQKIPGQAESFVEHIQKGIELTAADPRALLLFSGGVTRKDAGPRSEGQNYWIVADSNSWFGHSEVRSRAHTEEHARDSLENLLFSICRFKELTGDYPDEVTVVSYDFKKERFSKLHRRAVGFPADKFHFVGTEPPNETKAQRGEEVALDQFRNDMYGCRGELLEKKLRRNPFAVSIPYTDTCPEMDALMAYCGRGDTPFAGRLPWRPTISLGRKGGAFAGYRGGSESRDAESEA